MTNQSWYVTLKPAIDTALYWPGAILKRIGLQKVAARYCFMLANHSALNLFGKKTMTQFYSRFVSPGDIVIDAGANVGHKAEVFAGLGARVVAIEPQPRCVRRLQERFARNPLVTIIRKAVSDYSGTATMYISKAHTLSTISGERAANNPQFWAATIAVDVVTLDAIIAALPAAPVFCKIDVEGHEDKVLCGLHYPIRAISFEYTPGTDIAANAIARLAQLGDYRFNFSRGESLDFDFDQWVDAITLKRHLLHCPEYGDIYARLENRLNDTSILPRAA